MRAPPQVFVEDLAQLLETRERDQLSGILQPDTQDDLSQRRGRERPQRRRQLRFLEQTAQQSAIQATSKQLGRHGASIASGYRQRVQHPEVRTRIALAGPLVG
jgi:hypothetical protein